MNLSNHTVHCDLISFLSRAMRLRLHFTIRFEIYYGAHRGYIVFLPISVYPVLLGTAGCWQGGDFPELYLNLEQESRPAPRETRLPWFHRTPPTPRISIAVAPSGMKQSPSPVVREIAIVTGSGPAGDWSSSHSRCAFMADSIKF